jgi:3',5'-cyclic AMP phosphodiesterase CpdA
MRIVAHVSDLHFGRHDPALAEALLDALATAQPHLVVVSGDLTQRARRQEFAAARDWLARIRAPLLVIPGNHDVPLWSPIRRFFRPRSRFGRYVSTLRAPAYADDESAVLGLDTARRLPFKNGRVSTAQIAELGRFFAAVGPGVTRIVATHHPLALPTGIEDEGFAAVGRSRRALDAVARAGVDIMLSGHFHASLSGAAAHAVELAGPAHSILVVHAGTAISTRTREEANAWNLLRIEPGAVDVAILAASGRGFAEIRRDSYLRRDGAWVAAETELVNPPP